MTRQIFDVGKRSKIHGNTFYLGARKIDCPANAVAFQVIFPLLAPVIAGSLKAPKSVLFMDS